MTKLWSLHDPSFDLRTGKVDHLKSAHYQSDQKIRDAYHRLWDLIGEPKGQVIWCYTENQFPKPGIAKRLWTMEVEENQFICRIDDVAWNRIIGQELDFGFRVSPDGGDAIVGFTISGTSL